MIAYHGTAADPETIKREGLQPIHDFRTEADKVLAEYPQHRLPKWVYQHIQWEVNTRISTGNGKIHCTLSKSQAWARRKRYPYKTRQSYVVTVEIPMDQHTAMIKAKLTECDESWLELRESGGWDITVDSVLPKHIIRIEEAKGGE